MGEGLTTGLAGAQSPCGKLREIPCKVQPAPRSSDMRAPGAPARALPRSDGAVVGTAP